MEYYILLTVLFFISLIVTMICIYYIKILETKLDKLNKQVYYWSRQIPVRGKQAKSVKTVRRQYAK